MFLSWPKWSTCFDLRVESTFGFEMISMVLGLHLSECTCISENPRLLFLSLSQDGGADLNGVESADFGMHIHFHLDMSSCLKSMIC